MGVTYESRRRDRGVKCLSLGFWEAVRTNNRLACNNYLRGAELGVNDRMILIPANNSNVHFTLVIVDLLECVAWQYDPLIIEVRDLTQAGRIGEVIGQHIHRTFTTQSWLGPQQGNSVDCGIYVFLVIAALLKGQQANDRMYVNCKQTRQQLWEILLEMWWQEQRANGMTASHRERGVREVHNAEIVDLNK